MTTTRRIDASSLLAVLGGVLLLVSLFLDWYEPGLSAWDLFEVLDLVLAAVAVTAILAAVGQLTEANLLPWLGGIAFVLVVATLLDRPPVVGDGDPDVGLWLALAGAACLAAGALLSVSRISLAFDVRPRERTRTVAVVPEDDTTVAMPPDPPVEPKP